MKAVVITVIALLSTIALSAQERFTVLIGAGVGSYKMETMKHQQDQFVSNYPGMKNVSNFPAYLYYSGEIYLRLNKLLSLGLIYRLQSTGARASYSDYSGSLTTEQWIHSNNVGVAADFCIWSADRISLSAQLRAYYGFTRYKLNQQLELGSSWIPTPWHVESSSTSISLNPDVTGSYNVWDNLYLNVHAGYAIDFKGMVDLIEPPGQAQMQFDWSGVRLGMSAAYKF